MRRVIAAVDWREAWIRCLLLWHLSLWLLFVFTRKNFPVQCGLFFGIAACVALAETLNGCAPSAGKNSPQNYFDERGVFAGSCSCAAVARLAFAMLPNFLVMASSMLVTVKRAEFRGKARELGAQAEAEAQAVPVPAVSERDEALTGGRIEEGSSVRARRRAQPGTPREYLPVDGCSFGFCRPCGRAR